MRKYVEKQLKIKMVYSIIWDMHNNKTHPKQFNTPVSTTGANNSIN